MYNLTKKDFEVKQEFGKILVKMNKTLDELRKEIDEIDHQIVEILAKRISVVRQVGELKNSQNIPVLDEKRRGELLDTVGEKAKSLNVSKEFVKKLFAAIHDHAVELQKKI